MDFPAASSLYFWVSSLAYPKLFGTKMPLLLPYSVFNGKQLVSNLTYFNTIKRIQTQQHFDVQRAKT
jgi:hypothetical protein